MKRENEIYFLCNFPFHILHCVYIAYTYVLLDEKQYVNNIEKCLIDKEPYIVSMHKIAYCYEIRPKIIGVVIFIA